MKERWLRVVYEGGKLWLDGVQKRSGTDTYEATVTEIQKKAASDTCGYLWAKGIEREYYTDEEIESPPGIWSKP